MALSVDIRLSYGDFSLKVAQDFQLSGVTGLFGPSGSGKSTLLRVIAGLEARAIGRVAMKSEVWQDGHTHVPPHRRGVGYVFQDTRLFPHLTVRGNLDYAFRRAKALGGPSTEEIVDALDLGTLLARRPSQISGGEKQRVAIGRALLTAPKVLLMDEPLAALDEARKADILPYLERLCDQSRVPILYVSHSVAEVARLAQHMVVLRDGRVLRTGPAAEVLSDPEAVPMVGSREAGAVIEARIVAQHEDGLTELAVSAGSLFLPRIEAAMGDALRLRIPAQDVILARTRPEGLSALNILPVTVTEVKIGEGPGAVVQLRAGQDLLLARLTRRSVAALGLKPGVAAHAVLKSVALAKSDIGTPHMHRGADSGAI
ncbi:molybdenum ABC transporter ATP-binding protein [Dongia deserti]|uniref:molybdenum ABC transporter ATP-binding protein n=1 Tax=Dongia deserti TaxID=2268030 RepID=UPI000E64DC7E|nr:molybdenum ABC transporter ATP-binding protein [Dongia deserti]